MIERPCFGVSVISDDNGLGQVLVQVVCAGQKTLIIDKVPVHTHT